ncbi:calcium-activated potassium channel subunit beta-2 isoform X2 [Erpetoichthys calabaricus]|nr:calcium-activated potassium channel subunit beta-2 isoform X2 [Erpetoichthys calabaricus]
MFLWTSTRASQGTQHERRTFYQKIRQYELLDKKKTVTALKAGEDRAILLGLAMIALSMMMYFLLGITMIRSYKDSVWKGESRCSLFNLSIIGDRNCTYSCGTDCLKVSKYPCLRVYVNLSSSGKIMRLSHMEMPDVNTECFYVPKCKKNSTVAQGIIDNISDYFKNHPNFSCFYDPSEKQENVILTRLYGPHVIFHSLFWPSCVLTGGTLIVAMVKLTQYLSMLCERISKIKR